jgi:excisionase family DNA binding protein
MAPTEELLHDLVDLQAAERSSRGKPREHVRRVEARMRERIGAGVTKTVAARVLGVSVPTIDKWIDRGRIPTTYTPKGRRRVALGPLVSLAGAVQELREAGQTDGLVAAALLRLQQSDPAFRQELVDLYGPSLDAMSRGDLVPAAIPDDFGPDD